MSRSDWALLGDHDALRARGLFVAEGRRIVNRVLGMGAAEEDGERPAAGPAALEVVRVLASPAAAAALDLERRCLTVLEIVPADEMRRATGFNFHRGVLALVRRPTPTSLPSLLATVPRPGPLVVAEHLVDVDNVGSLFRNAHALGAAGVVLDDRSADPLYRKAVRTSMGAVLALPWTVVPLREAWPALAGSNYRTIAMTPRRDARALREVLTEVPERPVVLVVGNEGEGLSDEALSACEAHARLPMADGADSLNVATAVAVALYEWTRSRDLRRDTCDVRRET